MTDNIDKLLRRFEVAAYETALAVCNGQIKRAAKALGLNRTTLSMRLTKLGIDVDEFRDFIEVDENFEMPVKQMTVKMPRVGILRQTLFKRVQEELEKHNGHRTRTAQALGISTRCLRYYMNDMELAGMAVPEPRRKNGTQGER